MRILNWPSPADSVANSKNPLVLTQAETGIVQASPAESIVAAAVECLRKGGLVALPTDTLYGLAAAASNDAGVRRLFEAKKRPLGSPLPVLIADLKQVESIAARVPPAAMRLAERFWPGPLTLVFERSPRFRSLALAGGESVALRVPDHDVPRLIVRALGEPITGTSANLSGRPPATTVDAVAQQLGESVNLAINAGPCAIGVESTVIDFSGDVPRLLREGALSRGTLEAVLGTPLLDAKE